MVTTIPARNVPELLDGRMPVSLRTLATIAFLCAFAVPSVGPAFAQTQPRVINSREFTMRYNALPVRGKVAEYRLYVSFNGGAFDYYDKVAPSKDRFTFKCAADGVYGFAVQAYLTDGSEEPSKDQLTVSQKIVIDTTAPKIVAKASTREGGKEGGVEWSIADDRLDAGSIRLEYRWPGESIGWQPIDEKIRFKANDTQTWAFSADKPRMEIRIRARDTANNESTTPPITVPPLPGNDKTVESGGAKSPEASIAQGIPASSTGGSGGYSPDSSSMLYARQHDFVINYRVQHGASGIGAVMLYYSTDGNKTWQLFKADEGMDKPPTEGGIPYRTTKDGLHGFIIVAKNRVGTSEEAPVTGTPARILVMVDTEVPKVDLGEIKVLSNGGNGALLDIRWSARDPNIMRQPISIMYKGMGKPDWTTIAERIDNTGSYRWAVPAEAGHEVFVKVIARDQAENDGLAETKDPVIVDLIKPSVEIQGINLKSGK